MASKSITISEEAYDYLKEIKGERSFSDVILSLSRQGEGILRFQGMFKDVDLSSVQKFRRGLDHDWDRRGHKFAD